jgi:hypothetical protein|tara:strand:+ start:289 stop:540 length:252 start_codon:yes stop_codon:yes gene_type:complete
MTTAKEHIERMQRNYKDDDVLAVAIWSAEDVRSRADDLKIKLTDEQIDDVLSYVEHKQDATLGISWDTLDWWIGVVSQGAVNG